MTVDPFGQWMGEEMAQEDIEATLNEAGWGVLSLADGDEPYSLPISFGYTGEDLYFAFIRDSPTDTKFRFIEEGKPARLLVTDIQGRFDWESLAVTGPVSPIERGTDEWVDMLDVFEDNAWFSSDFRRAGESVGLQGWRIEPEIVEGVEL